LFSECSNNRGTHVHGKNDFAEGSKILLYTDLDIENNFVRPK